MSKSSNYKVGRPAKPTITKRHLDRMKATVDRAWQVFNPDTLRRICEMDERAFAHAFGLEVTEVSQAAPDNFYAFRDNGSDILAVAHLDTVSAPQARTCNFVDTAAGPVVFSRALDDRLGAYVIMDLLPRLGITCDILLTVGEESGMSTASFFQPPAGKEYNWVIEFDRGGTDVVMYEYEDDDLVELVESAGADVGVGSFSDICYLDHLGVKAFNWGVGYRDYHYARSHAFLDDTMGMVARFVEFHSLWADVKMPHVAAPRGWGRGVTYGSYGGGWRDEQDEEWEAWHAEWEREQEAKTRATADIARLNGDAVAGVQFKEAQG